MTCRMSLFLFPHIFTGVECPTNSECVNVVRSTGVFVEDISGHIVHAQVYIDGHVLSPLHVIQHQQTRKAISSTSDRQFLLLSGRDIFLVIAECYHVWQ